VARKGSPAGKLVWALIAVPFKLACIGLMIALPLLGVWVASSLAVFHNKSLVWAIAAGLVMFPLLPLLWEGLAHWRRSRKKKVGPRFLNLLDRMVLRTVTLNALFIGVLLAANPQAGFTALSARGDWMLAGKTGPRVEQLRKGLFQAADTLEWLYKLSKDNPYKKYDKDKGERPTPAPKKKADKTGEKPDRTDEKPDSTTGKKPDATDDQAKRRWPQPAALHALVSSFPPQEEKSPEWVGRYLAGRIADPLERARAIHDYVADRVAYDVPSYRAGKYPPQDAETVFRTGTGVCAGYARLFVAVSQAAGLEARYLVGDVRSENGQIDGEGHAWNAVKIEDRWHLVDVTWDSGHVSGNTFTKKLRTTYFLTPPEVFSADHFPEDPTWQLRDTPLTRGEFIRQPMMRPSFYAHGLKLKQPERSQVTVTNSLTIELDNPRQLFLLGTYNPQGGGSGVDCQVGEAQTSVTCKFPAAGSFDVKLFLSAKQYGSYDYVGKVMVNASGG